MPDTACTALPFALPSQEELLQRFHYDCESGLLTWKSGRQRGKLAGTRNKKYGGIQLTIGAQKFWAHRVIFKMLHGTEPPVVEHWDRNPDNDRPRNLRPATQGQNCCNRPRQVKQQKYDLPKGVRPSGDKFIARITVNRRRLYLGSFDDVPAAAAAYERAADRLHGQFARY